MNPAVKTKSSFRPLNEPPSLNKGSIGFGFMNWRMAAIDRMTRITDLVMALPNRRRYRRHPHEY